MGTRCCTQGGMRVQHTLMLELCSHNLCVVCQYPHAGNTIHLQQPDAIVARVSRLTYGVGCGRSPTAECCRVGNIKTDKHGRQWCSTHFWPQVKVDEVGHLAVHCRLSIQQQQCSGIQQHTSAAVKCPASKSLWSEACTVPAVLALVITLHDLIVLAANSAQCLAPTRPC